MPAHRPEPLEQASETLVVPREETNADVEEIRTLAAAGGGGGQLWVYWQDGGGGQL